MVGDFRPLPSIFSTAVSHLLSLRGSFLLPRVHRAQGRQKPPGWERLPSAATKDTSEVHLHFRDLGFPSPFTKVSFEAFLWDACRARGLGCGIKAQRQSASLYFLYFVLSIWDQRRVRREKDAEHFSSKFREADFHKKQGVVRKGYMKRPSLGHFKH